MSLRDARGERGRAQTRRRRPQQPLICARVKGNGETTRWALSATGPWSNAVCALRLGTDWLAAVTDVAARVPAPQSRRPHRAGCHAATASPAAAAPRTPPLSVSPCPAARASRRGLSRRRLVASAAAEAGPPAAAPSLPFPRHRTCPEGREPRRARALLWQRRRFPFRGWVGAAPRPPARPGPAETLRRPPARPVPSPPRPEPAAAAGREAAMSLLSALVPLLRVYCIGLRVILHQLRRRFQPRCAPASGEHRSRRRGAGRLRAGGRQPPPRRGESLPRLPASTPNCHHGQAAVRGPGADTARPSREQPDREGKERTGQGSRDLGYSEGCSGRAASREAGQGPRHRGGPGTGAAAGLLPCSPSPAERHPPSCPRAAAPGGAATGGAPSPPPPYPALPAGARPRPHRPVRPLGRGRPGRGAGRGAGPGTGAWLHAGLTCGLGRRCGGSVVRGSPLLFFLSLALWQCLPGPRLRAARALPPSAQVGAWKAGSGGQPPPARVLLLPAVPPPHRGGRDRRCRLPCPGCSRRRTYPCSKSLVFVTGWHSLTAFKLTSEWRL